MDFRQEVFDFIKAQINEEVTLDANNISIISMGLSFALNFISNELHEPTKINPVIWEDQWITKRQIIESRILSKLGRSQRIYGRETSIKKLIQPETNVFLNENHLLGTTKAQTKLGLYHNDQLVAVATFSKPTKIDRKGEIYRSYEMIRYCTINGFTVVGGLSKLVTHFIKIEQPDDIMTYVDLEWSNGKSYAQLGFEMVEQTAPQDFWIHPTELVRHRDTANESLAPGVIRIQNAGNNKFIRFLK